MVVVVVVVTTVVWVAGARDILPKKSFGAIPVVLLFLFCGTFVAVVVVPAGAGPVSWRGWLEMGAEDSSEESLGCIENLEVLEER